MGYRFWGASYKNLLYLEYSPSPASGISQYLAQLHFVDKMVITQRSEQYKKGTMCGLFWRFSPAVAEVNV